MQMRPRHPGIDLVIVDAPEDLVVPVISPMSVPSWNKRETDYFDQLFAFADCHLTDDGVVLLFHPKDRRIEKKLDSKIKIYDFTIVRDWWGYNPIPMASSLPHQKEVLSFMFIIWISQSDNQFQNPLILEVVLQTHNFNIKVFARLSSKFRTRRLRPQFVQMEILPEERDDLTNFTTTESQLLRPTGLPWRGSREKDPSFVQCFIECLTDERDIVCDWSPSTGSQSLHSSFTTAKIEFHFLISVFQTAGASVIACQRSNRHLIALEPDSEIFEALLKPYVDAIPQPEERADSTTDSDSEEDIAPKKKKGRKYCGAS